MSELEARDMLARIRASHQALMNCRGHKIARSEVIDCRPDKRVCVVCGEYLDLSYLVGYMDCLRHLGIGPESVFEPTDE